jgi:hypothetical protein
MSDTRKSCEIRNGGCCKLLNLGVIGYSATNTTNMLCLICLRKKRVMIINEETRTGSNKTNNRKANNLIQNHPGT